MLILKLIRCRFQGSLQKFSALFPLFLLTQIQIWIRQSLLQFWLSWWQRTFFRSETLIQKASLPRFFILRTSRSASSSFLTYFKISIFLFIIFLCDTNVSDGEFWGASSFSLESISDLKFWHVFLQLDIWNVFCVSFAVLELFDFILNVDEKFVDLPCGLFNGKVHPFYEIECFAVKNFFIQDPVDFEVKLIIELHDCFCNKKLYKIWIKVDN